jgi:CheY-like chemotaxis protein
VERKDSVDQLGKSSVANAPAAELNNLLQIIAATTHQLEDIWDGDHGSEKYLSMLRASVERAASITAELVAHAAATETRPAPLVSMAPRPPEPAYGSETARRILVVDDDPAALLLFEQFLSVPGYEIVTAQSGFECLDRLARGGNFDLVILDYLMPFMDGAETFRRIRAVKPEMSVLLSTAFIEQACLDAMLAKGLAGFMRKPLAPNELLECIQRLLPANPSAGAASGAGGIAAAL